MQMSEIKKLALRGLLPVLCALMLLGPLTAAGRAVSTVTAQLRPDVTIVIDGSQRVFYNAAGQQVHPISYGGTTYLPLRAIGELMGKNVDWNGETKTASLGGVRTGGVVAGTPDTAAQKQDISVEIRDDFTILVDGTARSFADAAGGVVYPLLYQGSTYLPIRAIGQLMGKSVDWDSKTRTVTLSGSLVTDADSFSGGTGTAPSAPAGGIVSAEDAKAAALAHAGLTAATFTKQELEWEDGRQVYDIEFHTEDYSRYDYEIDALTGAVRSFSQERSATSSGGTGTVIGLDRAREIALAQVPGAAADSVRQLELDQDDGRQIYEVELVFQGWEYELELDAVTGAVIKFESEPAHQ